MGNKLNLEKKVIAFRNMRVRLMKALANNSVNFFKVTNFEAQGFVGSPGHVDRWAARKKEKKTKSKGERKILVDTGAGRQSIKVAYVDANKVIIRAEVPYMAYHNEGAGNLPKRQFMGESEELNRQNKVIIDRHMKRFL